MLSQLDIYRFRNISEAHLSLAHNNLLVGLNGSGKTSVLEAIHLLAYGKSFRHCSIESVITHNEKDLIVSGRFDGEKAGVQRLRNGTFSVRLNGEDIGRVSELSRRMPTHVIEPNSVQLVEGSPSERRRFLDFTMFHVEHNYLEKHKRFMEALKHRNALLKESSSSSRQQMPYWTQLYADAAWELHATRERLFSELLLPSIQRCCDVLLPDENLELIYDGGCRQASDPEEFKAQLVKTAHQDVRFKATQVGPHRADILLKYNGKLAKDYLSRGQKKLLTYGVRLAPALMLQRVNATVGKILIDDMPSELDEISVRKVCDLLTQIESQTILTAVDETNRQVQIIREQLNPKMFHVEHGSISG